MSVSDDCEDLRCLVDRFEGLVGQQVCRLRAENSHPYRNQPRYSSPRPPAPFFSPARCHINQQHPMPVYSHSQQWNCNAMSSGDNNPLRVARKKAACFENQLLKFVNPKLVTSLNRRSAKAACETEKIGKMIIKLKKLAKRSDSCAQKKHHCQEMIHKLKSMLMRQKNEWQCVGRLKETMAIADEMKSILKFISHLTYLLDQPNVGQCRRLPERPPSYEITCGLTDDSILTHNTNVIDQSFQFLGCLGSPTNVISSISPCFTNTQPLYSQSEITVSLSMDLDYDDDFEDDDDEDDEYSCQRSRSRRGRRKARRRPRSSKTESLDRCQQRRRPSCVTAARANDKRSRSDSRASGRSIKSIKIESIPLKRSPPKAKCSAACEHVDRSGSLKKNGKSACFSPNGSKHKSPKKSIIVTAECESTKENNKSVGSQGKSGGESFYTASRHSGKVRESLSGIIERCVSECLQRTQCINKHCFTSPPKSKPKKHSKSLLHSPSKKKSCSCKSKSKSASPKKSCKHKRKIPSVPCKLKHTSASPKHACKHSSKSPCARKKHHSASPAMCMKCFGQAKGKHFSDSIEMILDTKRLLSDIDEAENSQTSLQDKYEAKKVTSCASAHVYKSILNQNGACQKNKSLKIKSPVFKCPKNEKCKSEASDKHTPYKKLCCCCKKLESSTSCASEISSAESQKPLIISSREVQISVGECQAEDRSAMPTCCDLEVLSPTSERGKNNNLRNSPLHAPLSLTLDGDVTKMTFCFQEINSTQDSSNESKECMIEPVTFEDKSIMTDEILSGSRQTISKVMLQSPKISPRSSILRSPTKSVSQRDKNIVDDDLYDDDDDDQIVTQYERRTTPYEESDDEEEIVERRSSRMKSQTSSPSHRQSLPSEGVTPSEFDEGRFCSKSRQSSRDYEESLRGSVMNELTDFEEEQVYHRKSNLRRESDKRRFSKANIEPSTNSYLHVYRESKRSSLQDEDPRYSRESSQMRKSFDDRDSETPLEEDDESDIDLYSRMSRKSRSSSRNLGCELPSEDELIRRRSSSRKLGSQLLSKDESSRRRSSSGKLGYELLSEDELIRHRSSSGKLGCQLPSEDESSRRRSSSGKLGCQLPSEDESRRRRSSSGKLGSQLLSEDELIRHVSSSSGKLGCQLPSEDELIRRRSSSGKLGCQLPSEDELIRRRYSSGKLGCQLPSEDELIRRRSSSRKVGSQLPSEDELIRRRSSSGKLGSQLPSEDELITHRSSSRKVGSQLLSEDELIRRRSSSGKLGCELPSEDELSGRRSSSGKLGCELPSEDELIRRQSSSGKLGCELPSEEDLIRRRSSSKKLGSGLPSDSHIELINEEQIVTRYSRVSGNSVSPGSKKSSIKRESGLASDNEKEKSSRTSLQSRKSSLKKEIDEAFKGDIDDDVQSYRYQGSRQSHLSSSREDMGRKQSHASSGSIKSSLKRNSEFTAADDSSRKSSMKRVIEDESFDNMEDKFSRVSSGSKKSLLKRESSLKPSEFSDDDCDKVESRHSTTSRKSSIKSTNPKESQMKIDDDDMDQISRHSSASRKSSQKKNPSIPNTIEDEMCDDMEPTSRQPSASSTTIIRETMRTTQSSPGRQTRSYSFQKQTRTSRSSIAPRQVSGGQPEEENERDILSAVNEEGDQQNEQDIGSPEQEMELHASSAEENTMVEDFVAAPSDHEQLQEMESKTFTDMDETDEAYTNKDLIEKWWKFILVSMLGAYLLYLFLCVILSPPCDGCSSGLPNVLGSFITSAKRSVRLVHYSPATV